MSWLKMGCDTFVTLLVATSAYTR